MKVVRARSAGFCMGVSRALQRLNEALHDKDTTLVMLGPVIHNTQVIASYLAQGVVMVDTVEDVLAIQKQNASPVHVLIRAHGIPIADEERLRAFGVLIIDATCPRVKEAQVAIAKATQGGVPLMLFGESTHPEVLGLRSYAQGACFVFESPAEAVDLALKAQYPLVLAAQTTQEAKQFEIITQMFTKHSADVRVLSTICNATGRRQAEAIAIAEQADGMVIVGGKSSGNTRRLMDIALAHNLAAWHVETLDELMQDTFFLEKKEKIRCMGLTAGASTPKSLIDELASYLVKV